jgi:manganese-dependent inorganic pyrophosphatase
MLAGLVPAGPLLAGQEAALATLGADLLTASAGLGQRQSEEVIRADLKTYSQGSIRFTMAQVEVPGFDELEERVDEIHQALEILRERQDFNFTLLLVTDVVRGSSRLVTTGPPRLFDGLSYPRLRDGTLDAPGLVSRKKQLLPAMLAALEMV